MKIEVIKGKIGNSGIGETIELDNDKALRLIKLGYAKKFDGKSGSDKSDETALAGDPKPGGGT